MQHDVTTVGDLTSVPETGTGITNQREPIDAPYMCGVLIPSSNLMVIIEIDIRKHPLTRQVTTSSLLTTSSTESLNLNITTVKQV